MINWEEIKLMMGEGTLSEKEIGAVITLAKQVDVYDYKGVCVSCGAELYETHPQTCAFLILGKINESIEK
jgi:hypothetical protein